MAKANTTDEVCEWQLSKNTVSKRIKHLYRNPLMADVYFLVANTERGSSVTKLKIPCHKFVLAVSSPVFFAMFYGKLQEPSKYINLPDCDSKGLLEFLRYIYCDEVKLTGSCVLQVLYLAKKYMIPSLTTQCRRFLEKNINAENVLDVLPAMHQLEEAGLYDICWEVVDAQTETILQSAPDSFLEDEDLLVSILKRDTLQVKEVEVFQAVNRWAEGICKKRGLSLCGEQKRTIVGETIVKLVRFPLMPQKVFAKLVPDSGILTETEINQMFMYFNLNRKPGEFSCIPRCIRRCKRFTEISGFWYYNRGVCDSISFTVNIPVVLRGIRLFGCKGEKYYVKLTMNGEIVSEDRFLTEETESDGYNGFDIVFKQCYQLTPNTPYVLEALIKGPKSFYGMKGKEEVVCQNVTFRFIGKGDITPNCSTVSQGQFAEILFS